MKRFLKILAFILIFSIVLGIGTIQEVKAGVLDNAKYNFQYPLCYYDSGYIYNSPDEAKIAGENHILTCSGSESSLTGINLINSTELVNYDTLNKSEGSDHFDDEDTNVWENGEITERVDVTVQRESQFEVTIPKDIVLDGKTGQADYIVNAKGDIAGNQVLKVVPDAEFEMTEAGGKASITATVTQDNTEYTYQEMLDEGTNYPGNVTVTLTAGEWEGKFAFNISFEDVSHTHNYIPEEIAPTCTSIGYTKYMCNCGATYNKGEVAKLEHVYKSEVTKEANCIETGVRTYTCECGEYYTENIVINSNRHNYINGFCICGDSLPELGQDLETYSWTEIAKISKAGEATNYFSIGDEKKVTINDKEYTIQIYGFNHDDLADGSGKAGITFGFKELMTSTHNMNSTATNIGGWETSEIRDYLQNDILPSLPEDLQSVIKEVKKISDIGNKDTTTLINTVDKLFLPSFEEVGLTKNDETNFVLGQGYKYDIFSDDVSRIKYNLNGSASYWWTRSASTYGTIGFWSINPSGKKYSYAAQITRGVTPCFCI